MKTLRNTAAICLAFGMIFSSNVFASCPRATPADEKFFDSYSDTASAVYEYYIEPIQKVVKVGKSLSSANPSGQVMVLNEIYKNHAKIAKNGAEMAYFIDTVRGNYRGSNASFKNLDTNAALAMLGASGAQNLKSILQGTTLCVGGVEPQYAQFEISFYGARKKECEQLVASAAARGMADAILVNQVPNGECLKDHIGTARNKWKLWSWYGRNQASYIIGR